MSPSQPSYLSATSKLKEFQDRAINLPYGSSAAAASAAAGGNRSTPSPAHSASIPRQSAGHPGMRGPGMSSSSPGLSNPGSPAPPPHSIARSLAGIPASLSSSQSMAAALANARNAVTTVSSSSAAANRHHQQQQQQLQQLHHHHQQQQQQAALASLGLGGLTPQMAASLSQMAQIPGLSSANAQQILQAMAAGLSIPGGGKDLF